MDVYSLWWAREYEILTIGFLDLAIDLPSLGNSCCSLFSPRGQSQVNQRSFLRELALYDRARRMVPGTRFAFYQRCAGEAAMVNETELFYLVMLILLTLIIHLVLMMTEPRRDGKAHR
jgi:hypothetical protein